MPTIETNAKIQVENLSYAYGAQEVLRGISINVPARAITVFLGPAGGGKTTLLRLVNRLNDLVDSTHLTGRILLDGQDIYAPGTNVADLRRRVGMVFALPLPLPGTVRENVTYGPRLAGVRDRKQLDEVVERSLTQAALWDEVKDRLDDAANRLSGGQQQRLCIARSLALEPEVLLLDEPTSGLDPISTAKVEGSLFQLKQDYTIVIVPHSVQQAARVADYAAFFLMGELVEQGPGKTLFTAPQNKRTEDYVTGRFG
jgi:phosphate transport system ATP-binding protein